MYLATVNIRTILILSPCSPNVCCVVFLPSQILANTETVWGKATRPSF